MNYKALSYTTLIMLGVLSIVVLFYIYTVIMFWIVGSLFIASWLFVVGWLIYNSIND